MQCGTGGRFTITKLGDYSISRQGTNTTKEGLSQRRQLRRRFLPARPWQARRPCRFRDARPWSRFFRKWVRFISAVHCFQQLGGFVWYFAVRMSPHGEVSGNGTGFLCTGGAQQEKVAQGALINEGESRVAAMGEGAKRLPDERRKGRGDAVQPDERCRDGSPGTGTVGEGRDE